MYESLIVRHCSPTLAAIKTGNIFNWSFDCVVDLQVQINDLNLRLNPKGVYVRILRNTYNKALVYIYRPNKLIKDFLDADTKEILLKFGYSNFDMDSCIEILSRRLSQRDEFPHEIGLFLG